MMNRKKNKEIKLGDGELERDYEQEVEDDGEKRN